jgi:hypothetical protein
MKNKRRQSIYKYSVLDLPFYSARFFSQHESGWSLEKHISGLKQQSNQA